MAVKDKDVRYVHKGRLVYARGAADERFWDEH